MNACHEERIPRRPWYYDVVHAKLGDHTLCGFGLEVGSDRCGWAMPTCFDCIVRWVRFKNLRIQSVELVPTWEANDLRPGVRSWNAPFD